jgi:hypothetical protein
MRLLLEKNADAAIADIYGQTALMMAVFNGQLECLKLMIDAKVDVNRQDDKGSSGLHIACQEGHVECVRQILDSKADVHLRTNHGQTGLTLASAKGHLECLKLMIDAKANVNQQTIECSTGLHFTCQHGYTECLRLLIDSKADVQHQDELGQTGLVMAAFNEHLECLKLMIDSKADINQQLRSSSALSIAVEKGNLSSLFMLLDQRSVAPASGHVKAAALLQALGPDGFPTQNQTAAFILLACGADVKRAINTTVPRAHVQSATSRYRNVLGFIDSWHGVAVTVLSDLVEVDTRVGRGDFGMYQEPLERVLQYLGLSMTVNQVVNTKVDGKNTRRALMPKQARGANQWHTLFKRTHCASCSVCPEQKMKRCPCGAVWYCSTDCQRQHWKKQHAPDHKRIIKQQKEERKKKKQEEQQKAAK